MRFSATPQFASWKRSVSKQKRSCSSAISSASASPGIAFQRRPVNIGEQQKVQSVGHPKLEKWLKPRGGRSCFHPGGMGMRWRTLCIGSRA